MDLSSNPSRPCSHGPSFVPLLQPLGCLFQTAIAIPQPSCNGNLQSHQRKQVYAGPEGRSGSSQERKPRARPGDFTLEVEWCGKSSVLLIAGGSRPDEGRLKFRNNLYLKRQSKEPLSESTFSSSSNFTSSPIWEHWTTPCPTHPIPARRLPAGNRSARTVRY